MSRTAAEINSEVPATFAATVRAARARRRLTQADVAAAAGVGINRVRQIESGTRDPLLSTATAVAAAVGVILEMREVAA
jgi:transcriptional regulator with XRE-family HTH domain